VVGELRSGHLLDRVADHVREADWWGLRVRVVVVPGAAARRRAVIQHDHVSHLADPFPDVLVAVVEDDAERRGSAHREAPQNGGDGAAPVLARSTRQIEKPEIGQTIGRASLITS
jgi:hypothetical protein